MNSETKCLECKDTGRIKLFSHVEDCQNCDAAFTHTILISNNEPDSEDVWDEVEPSFQKILDSKLKIVRLLICQSAFTCKLTNRFAFSGIPILAEIFPRGKDNGYDRRFYNLRMPGVWMNQQQATTAIVDGKSKVHYVLECVKHEG